MKGQAIDAVFRFDVHRVAVRVGENAAHRRGDHAVAVWISEDNHASSDGGVASQQAMIDAAWSGARLVSGVTTLFTDFARRDIYHRTTATPDNPSYDWPGVAPYALL